LTRTRRPGCSKRTDGQTLAGALIPPIVLISLFVLAATTALAVNLRTRRFALLRAVGATRGQVRRAIGSELTLCGLAGGALGWLPGMGLGALGAHALAGHQMLPAGSAAWLSRGCWPSPAASARSSPG
jgi:ABC-type antimicrobial peptide transport system permease subunit